jgi:hypothetical protein
MRFGNPTQVERRSRNEASSGHCRSLLALLEEGGAVAVDIIVWNSQGAKWDFAWDHYVKPSVAAGKDVMLLLVETGWAPWVLSGDVTCNCEYRLGKGENALLDKAGVAKSTFCAGTEQRRGNWSLWVPWVDNFSAMKTNSRCSIGAGIFMPKFSVHATSIKMNEDFKRPSLCLSIAVGVQVFFTIFLVHMVSGSPKKAEAQLVDVMKDMSERVPESTAALIVGDMNVDLLAAGAMSNLPSHWSILQTGAATHQGGSELDYGLLYDPKSQFQATKIIYVEKFGTVNNQSDHSMLVYGIPQ